MGLCGKSRVVLGGETLNDDEPEWAIKNAFGVVLMQQSLAQSLFLIAVGFLGSQSWGSAEPEFTVPGCVYTKFLF